MKPNNIKNLVPTGAGLAAICFFLPWIKFSCSPEIKVKQTLSGYDLGHEYWVVFIAAIAILGAFFGSFHLDDHPVEEERRGLP